MLGVLDHLDSGNLHFPPDHNCLCNWHFPAFIFTSLFFCISIETEWSCQNVNQSRACYSISQKEINIISILMSGLHIQVWMCSHSHTHTHLFHRLNFSNHPGCFPIHFSSLCITHMEHNCLHVILKKLCHLLSTWNFWWNSL